MSRQPCHAAWQLVARRMRGPTLGWAACGDEMSCWKYSDVARRSGPCCSSDRRVTRVDTCRSALQGRVVVVKSRLGSHAGGAPGSNRRSSALLPSDTLPQSQRTAKSIIPSIPPIHCTLPPLAAPAGPAGQAPPPTHLQPSRQLHLQQVGVIRVPLDAALHLARRGPCVRLHQAGWGAEK